MYTYIYIYIYIHNMSAEGARRPLPDEADDAAHLRYAVCRI